MIKQIKEREFIDAIRFAAYDGVFTSKKTKGAESDIEIPPITMLDPMQLFCAIKTGIQPYEVEGVTHHKNSRKCGKLNCLAVCVATSHKAPRNKARKEDLLASRTGSFMIDIDFKNGANAGQTVESIREKIRAAGFPLALIDHITYNGGLRLYFVVSEEVLNTYSHEAILEAMWAAFEGIDVECDRLTDLNRFSIANYDPKAIWNADHEDFELVPMEWIEKWNPKRRELSSEKSKATDDDTARYIRKMESYLSGIDFRKDRSPNKDWRLCLFDFAVSCAAGYIPKIFAREWARERFEFLPDAKTSEARFKAIFDEAYESRTTQDNEKHNEEERVRDERLRPDRYRVRTDDEIEPPTPVLTAPDDEIIVSLCNLLILLGKAKTKKTFLTILLVAGYIASREKLEIGEILFFDTEQGASHTQKIANRLKALCGGTLDEEGFQLYALRELMPKDRAEFIERVCRENKPRLVVIDGIVDICQNFLDLEKSTETVQQLMTLSGELNCAILGVLHENKGKDDRNGRGHLGTIATQKAETVMNLSVNEHCKDLVTVEFTYTRNKPPQPFTFAIDGEGLPYISSHALPKIPKDYELWKSRLPEPMGYADLRRAVMADTGKTQTTAENHIRKGVESGVIEQVEGRYQLAGIGF